jgi:CTP synthase
LRIWRICALVFPLLTIKAQSHGAVYFHHRRRGLLARQRSHGGKPRRLLQARGFKVRIRKFDPYLNVDPGTMSPYQHGEVFVTDDGAETDLDLGHYERFTGVSARKSDNITWPDLSDVIAKERRGDYLGATVQVIPHVTDAIKDFAQAETDDLDFVLCEIGGTVGDIEGLPFIEAIRQLRNDLGREQTCFAHVTLVPYIAAAGELKTKPTQHGARTDQPWHPARHPAVPLRASAARERARQDRAVLQRAQGSGDPGAGRAQHLCRAPAVSRRRAGRGGAAPLRPDRARAGPGALGRLEAYANPEGEVTIGVVGKYVVLQDAYKSLNEALVHGGMANKVKVNIKWIDAEIREGRRRDRRHARTAARRSGARRLWRARHGRQDRAVRFARERKVPSSASALACRWPASKARATRRASPMPRRPNSARPTSRWWASSPNG